MARRVSADDLEFAATWLDNYEGQEDDDNNDAARRVATWLRDGAERLREDAAVREIRRQTGATVAQARAALRRARNGGKA